MTNGLTMSEFEKIFIQLIDVMTPIVSLPFPKKNRKR